MAVSNTLTELDGLFKTVYADKLLDLVPDFAVLQKRLPFTMADKELGDHYEQPVALSQEGGFTFLGESDALANSDMNDAIAGVMAPAKVKGTQVVLRSRLSYLALARASKKGAKAFQRASSYKIEDMNNAIRKKIEIGMLYGQKSLGALASDPGDQTTSYTLTFSDGTWCPGIWVGSEGHAIDVFDSAGTTRRNTAAVTISSVDVDNKQITVACTANELDTATTGDLVYWRLARSSNGGTEYEMAGLQKIITNSGTLFNISASTYSLWKGTTVPSVGQLSFAKIQDAIAKAVNKGLMEKVVCLVSPRAWGVLNSDQAALRVLDSSYSSGKAENGAESLLFHSANGQIEVVSHPFVKEGDAFIVPLDSLLRLGSCDISFGVPGFDEQFFQLVPNKPLVELQCMTDQAVFLEKPAHAVFMTGITYS